MIEMENVKMSGQLVRIRQLVYGNSGALVTRKKALDEPAYTAHLATEIISYIRGIVDEE